MQQPMDTRGADSPSHPHAPLYLTIRERLLDAIARGEYETGTLLPSEHELAEQFSTTRLTVRSAVDELVSQGLVRRVPGKGMLVSVPWLDGGPSLDGFRKRYAALGDDVSVRVLSRGLRDAGPYFAHLFDIAESDAVYSVRRLNSLNGRPVSVEQATMPYGPLAGIERIDLETFGLYEAYEMCGHKVALVQERLGIESLSARDAGLLGVEPGDPSLVIECVSLDADGCAIEHSTLYNRGDRTSYSYTF
mgnify:CR=1 FL=1